MKKLFVFILCVLFYSSAFPQNITGSQILKNVKSRSSSINDYTADIEANVKLEMIKMPKVKIKVYFKQPDKFHYESKNFAMLPKGGVNFNPADFPEDKYDYRLYGKETINNVPVYAMEVTMKESAKEGKEKPKKDIKPGRTFIWVDADNWVVKRIVNEKDELFKVIIDFNHSWIDGKHYLPTWIKITYDIKTEPQAEQTEQKKPRNRLGKMQNGDITMSLQNYVVNSGLSDDLFKKENSK